MNPSLGPQCYTCRKRQVKCDSTKPTCQRCVRDGRVCQGYEKPIKVFTYDPKAYGKRAPPKPHAKFLDSARKSGSPAERTTSVQLYRPSADRDYLALLESFRYYELHVLPGLFPPALFGKPPGVDRNTPWHEVPPVVQNCLTVVFRSMHNESNALISNGDKELCYYRARSLKMLQDALPGAVEDPYGVALSCILLLVGAEFRMSPYSSWLLHFQAAQRLIMLRGGMTVCLATLPGVQQTLMHFLYQDLFTGTSANSDTLRENLHSLLDYPNILSRIEADYAFSPLFFPNTLLIALARTNIMRATPESSSTTDFTTIWHDIESFSAPTWALAALNSLFAARYGVQLQGDETSVDALVLFAECCRSATLLYLALSCQSFAPSTLHAGRLLKIYRDLCTHITTILSAAEKDLSGPPRSQLWRFNRWAVFVAAYARIAWFSPRDAELGGDVPEYAATEVLHEWTRDFTDGAQRHQMAREYLANVRWRRSLYEKWTWDDGFPERCCLFITKSIAALL